MSRLVSDDLDYLLDRRSKVANHSLDVFSCQLDNLLKSTLFLTNCTEPQLLKKANKTIEFGIRSFDMDTLTRNNLSHCFKRTRQVGEFLPAFISFKSDFFEDIQLTTLYDRIDEMQFEEFPFCKSLTNLN